MKRDIRDRFEDKYIPEPNSGCWLWLDHIGKARYGFISWKGKKHKAHRMSYQIYIGPIPPGMLICHKCDNPSCVNPDHLFLGTQTDNMRDMVRKGRANKKKGSANPTSKLTENDINNIRLADGSNPEIAKAYGVSRTAIYHIRNGRSWNHVDFPSEETLHDKENV